MKFGFVLPRGDAKMAVEFARAAEAAGWDGFFMWEPVWGVDPWVSLAAAAMATEQIRLGTLLTPVSRRRPWKLASETATLDNLSNGRLILSVGLGAVETGFANFGEETDRKIRAELLDEGLDIITGLWQGQPFNYSGQHYKVTETEFVLPDPPAQQPRIPIWVVGAWPRPKSMQRVLRYDGLLPMVLLKREDFRPPTPDDIAEMRAYAQEQRAEPLDIIVEGTTPGEDKKKGAEKARPFADAGATWWIESLWQEPDMEKILRRVQQGPPVL